MFHDMDGPKDQKRFAALVRDSNWLPATPIEPFSAKRGKKSATAAPMFAVAPWSCASARRMSGRRRRRSDGRPMGTSGGATGSVAAAGRGEECPRLQAQEDGERVAGLLRRSLER